MLTRSQSTSIGSSGSFNAPSRQGGADRFPRRAACPRHREVGAARHFASTVLPVFLRKGAQRTLIANPRSAQDVRWRGDEHAGATGLAVHALVGSTGLAVVIVARVE